MVDRETTDRENAPSLLEVHEEDPEQECGKAKVEDHA